MRGTAALYTALTTATPALTALTAALTAPTADLTSTALTTAVTFTARDHRAA